MERAGGKRRLATILAADVVGYSRLMAQDEEATLRTLKAHRDVTDKLISRHDGRIFSTAGDAVLAEFGSAVEAVRCAIAIQDELRVRNAELVPDRQMQFRIGINVGDVIVDGDDLLGDGVNIAARLEGIAQPGGICISGSTFEQVKNKLSVGFSDLGLHQVKNIPDPVAAFGITSAPVSVATASGAASNRAAWGRPLTIAAVVAVLLAAGAIWQFYPRGPLPLSAFPARITTDEMRTAQIAALMSGVTVRGRRLGDGQPFTIILNADRTADLQVVRSGALGGALERVVGHWRAEDYRFCLQAPLLARGRELCPRIVKDGSKIVATQRDGTPLPWELSK